SATGHFGIYFSTSGLCVFVFFKDQCPCTFPQDKTIPCSIKRSRCGFRALISGRKGMHGPKSSHTGNGYGGFAAPGHHYITISQTYGVQGIYYSICGGGTSRYRSIIWPHKTMFYGNISRCNIRDHFWDEERIEPGRTVPSSKIQDLVLKGFQSTDSSAPDNPCPEFIQFVQIQTGILNGLIGGNKCILCKPIQFTA